MDSIFSTVFGWAKFSMAMIPVLVVLPFLIAFLCYKLMQRKGYSKDSCLWNAIGGYFLGLIWVIVCLFRKDLSVPDPSKAAAAREDESVPHFGSDGYAHQSTGAAQDLEAARQALIIRWYEPVPTILAVLGIVVLVVMLFYGIFTHGFNIIQNVWVGLGIVALAAMLICWSSQDRKEKARLQAEYRRCQTAAEREAKEATGNS